MLKVSYICPHIFLVVLNRVAGKRIKYGYTVEKHEIGDSVCVNVYNGVSVNY